MLTQWDNDGGPPSATAHLWSLQRGDRLQTSESDVCKRQILTSKDDPRTERLKYL